MGSADLPDQPDGPDRARHARDGTAGTPRTRELHDPDERVRAYEAIRAHVSAETAEEASSGLQPDEDAQRSYRDEAPQLLETRADQDKRSAGERQADRSADPPEPGYRRGDLQPAHGWVADTTAAIGRVREAEPTISADVRAVERENRYGGRLEGFNHRIKDEDRLKEKLAEKLRFQPDREAAEIVREIPDTIRYTFCLRPEIYTAGYYDIMQRLEDRGYEMYYSKNWWTNPEYKGINTRWVTQAFWACASGRCRLPERDGCPAGTGSAESGMRDVVTEAGTSDRSAEKDGRRRGGRSGRHPRQIQIPSSSCSRLTWAFRWRHVS